jgi:hypothetical protein
MDPTTTFCPNRHCPARGQIGQGNIGIQRAGRLRYNTLCYDGAARRTRCCVEQQEESQRPENPTNIGIARQKSCDTALSGHTARKRGAILSSQGTYA